MFIAEIHFRPNGQLGGQKLHGPDKKNIVQKLILRTGCLFSERESSCYSLSVGPDHKLICQNGPFVDSMNKLSKKSTIFRSKKRNMEIFSNRIGAKYRMLFLYLLISFMTTKVWADNQKSEPLRIATYTYGNNSRMENLHPLANLIEKIFGTTVELKSYNDINDLVAAITQGKVDISFISTMGNLALNNGQHKHSMEAVLTMEVPQNASVNYRTAFVVPRESDIMSLKNISRLKGVRLALVSPESTSGNLIPRSVLAKMGISSVESFFGKIDYAGSHRSALEHVLDGRADLAAFGSSEYTEYVKKHRNNSKIRLIQLSDPIPLGPVLFNKSLDKNFQQELRQLLTSLHIEHPAVFAKITEGWIEAIG